MRRGSPTELRKALELVQDMAKAGILFVPIPVNGPKDHAYLTGEMQKRLERFAREDEEAAQ